MKKYLYKIVLFLVLLNINGTAWGTGVLLTPQQNKAVQTTAQTQKTPQLPTKIIQTTPIKQTAEKPFKPIIEPILKQHKVEDNLESKPFAIETTAEISNYEKISLSDAINYALSHNLDIRGNRLNTDIAKNNIKVANRLKNPSLMSYINFGRASTDNPDYVGLVFPIDIAKRGPRKNLAKSNLELTKGNVSLAEFYLRLDVRQAYVDLVSAKTTLKILNDNRKLLQDLLYIAQRKYEAGASPQMDVIHAKMTLNQVVIQANSANTQVYVARYNFNRLLNSTNFDSKDDLLPDQKDFIKILTPKSLEKIPDYKTLADIAIQKRLDLKNAQKEIDVAKKNLTLVIRQRIPDIEIGGGYLAVPAAMSTSDSFSQGTYIMGNITNIPLLYQYSPEIKNAKIQVEQKQLAYDSLKNQALQNLHSAYDEFTTAQDNLNYYNDILLSESKQFLGMSKRSYEVGKSNITDYIFIQQSYKNIMMGYTIALANYYNAWVNILKEINDEELKING